MAKVRFGIGLSTLVMLMTVTTLAHAHEIMPAVANIEQSDGQLVFEVETNIEALLTGADLSEVTNSDDFERVETYDVLRGLPPLALQSQFEASWSALAGQMSVMVDGAPAALTLLSTDITDQPDLELPRVSVVTFAAALPDGAAEFQFSWAKSMGTIIVRQNGVEDGYTGQLEAGATTDPIKLAGGSAMSGWQTFVFYIPVGFEHIVPLGLDHILFVLGLFFLSTQLRPLLIQVSAFTVAHTITLALAALGYVTVPGSIVEPLIAASIVFIAVENIFLKSVSPWRPFVIFGFGLLHGLGFASVLGDYGLPDGTFVAALIGFNIGVEVGQLFVIAIAFALVGYWFGKKDWYRRVISIPASVAIGIIGAWWVIERTLL